MTAITTTTAASSASQPQKHGFSALGQGDFMRLMVEQLKLQDPFSPVDNKEMLVQMAQFTSLATNSDMGETLKAIAGKLDAILAAQTAVAAPATPSETPSTPAAGA
ncbi:MAG TPA: flagellar hook capping FlgD N-terminal domain-containing protein [Novosphingobium sp.]|nr:flagellar hook capping FlgD N-terminal domain-containing protein [Novosphingobium sp.]